VLYNGVDRKVFRKLSETIINPKREIFGIYSKNKNIAYAGSLHYIKNADKLPSIFYLINKTLPETSFFIIGSGKLKNYIKYECDRLGIQVNFIENQNPFDMPALLNCMDLIILPSINEGLPLIALESLSCEVPIIGSRVSGIIEVIGIENTVELDECFINNISKLAIDVLRSKRKIPLDRKFDWEITAEIEAQKYELFNIANYQS
jgi:glycosyltransferase involved in cell wall biosynthesis